MNISAALFKAECLKLMDRVAKTGESVVITKHGKPVAQLSPIPPPAKSMFGYMKGTVQIKGDVMAPLDEEWHALSDKVNPAVDYPRTRRRAARGK